MPDTPGSRQPWIGRWIAELRRRHVIKVVGAYLLTSWGIIQVTTTIFPLISLPPWAATVVFIALLAGLPVVIFIAWTFDITPDGFHRTIATDAAAPVKVRFGRRSAIAVVILSIVLGGWAAVAKRRAADGLDARSVAVLPFNVSAEPSLQYLSEGIVDLIATKLNGEGGLRSVNPRTAIKAWRASVGAAGGDLDDSDAIQLARRLGAGQLLIGNAFASGRDISLSATLYDVATRAERVRAEVSGPADSALVLVDRLLAELLSRRAGERTDRLAALTTTSLPALKLYLDGQAAYRIGEFARSMDLFSAELDIDSTFALAGLAHSQAGDWVTGTSRRGLDIAWENRHRLGVRDRRLLEAMYVAPGAFKSYSHALAAWERAAALAHDDAEVIFHLGDTYFHFGAALGHADAHARALAAFERSLALDSTYTAALSHMFQFDQAATNPAALRAYADRYLRVQRADTTDPVIIITRWLIARTLGDSTLLRMAQASIDNPPASLALPMRGIAMSAAVPLQDVEEAMKATVAATVAVQPRAGNMIELALLAATMGKMEAAVGHLRAARAIDPVPQRNARALLALAEMFDGDTLLALDAARELSRLLETKEGQEPRSQYLRSQCALGRWEAMRGYAAAASRRLAVLERAQAEGDNTLQPWQLGACIPTLAAQIAVARNDADADAALARLDSLLVTGSFEWANQLPIGNIVSMRLHEQRGEYEAALAAARRQVFGLASYALHAQLLGQARLAARLGLRDEAVRAYRHYLQLRTDPDSGSAAAAAVNAARGELAALTAEGR